MAGGTPSDLAVVRNLPRVTSGACRNHENHTRAESRKKASLPASTCKAQPTSPRRHSICIDCLCLFTQAWLELAWPACACLLNARRDARTCRAETARSMEPSPALAQTARAQGCESTRQQLLCLLCFRLHGFSLGRASVQSFAVRFSGPELVKLSESWFRESGHQSSGPESRPHSKGTRL